MEAIYIRNYSCNLACDYCFNDICPRLDRNARSGRSKPMTVAEEARMIENLLQANIRRITITGGEPLLRKDLFEFLSLLKAQSFWMQVCSNGMFMDAKPAAKLASLPVDVLSITVDSLNPHYHDTWRGGLDITLTNLKRFLAMRKSTRVNVNMIVTSQNYPEMASLTEKMLAWGVDSVFMQPVYYPASNPHHRELSLANIAPEDHSRLAQSIGDWVQLQPQYRAYAAVLYEYYCNGGRLLGSCPMKQVRLFVTIDPYGNLFICPHRKETAVGDVLLDGIDPTRLRERAIIAEIEAGVCEDEKCIGFYACNVAKSKLYKFSSVADVKA